MFIGVSIVEDNDRVREGFARLIGETRGFRCLSTYRNAEEAIKHIPSLRPDVVLMDINLPRMSGVECVRRLKGQVPRLLIVMLTAYEDDDLIFQALKAGASGYLLKQIPPSELLAAIHEVQRGGAPMTSTIARKVIQSFHAGISSTSGTESLSPREREILDLLAKGYTNKEISETLGPAFHTIHTHVRNIYEKLHVNSRAGAVAKYLQQ